MRIKGQNNLSIFIHSFINLILGSQSEVRTTEYNENEDKENKQLFSNLIEEEKKEETSERSRGSSEKFAGSPMRSKSLQPT